ncbi:MAG: Ca2+-binding EF-hand superfamily protein [Motiliproteus sp.]|jgi:Ca2+-binding EF-hand superfamily protein
MKTSQLAKLAGFSTLLLLSAGSMAEEKALSSFEALDQDQNGSLTATEASQHRELSRQWTEIDQDESGSIDRVEFSAFETRYTHEKEMMQGPKHEMMDNQEQQGKEMMDEQMPSQAGEPDSEE